MTGNNANNAATHLGRQMKRDRLAHGWSLRELSARTGIDFATLSRVENGKRPSTKKLAATCDRVFPERRGWYSTYYDESKSWVPAGFRSWAEYEDKARTLRVWAPTIIHGLLQTESYARVMLAAYPGVSDEIVTARLASRMERQRRILHRNDPPDIHAIVDEAALYRRVGSAEVMADWRKSTYSGSDGGSCVEVGQNDAILVRDTTDRDGGTLTFTASAWQAFIAVIG